MEATVQKHQSEETTEDKIAIFNKWCDKVGIRCPKIQYPAYFEHGLLGAATKEEIHHREAFLFIPFNAMISVDTARNHPKIGHIFYENPTVFSKVNEDHEQLILTVYIMYEF
jgi:hypothetical protein